MPTRFNSEIYKHIGHCSEADSDFVKCLREAGALIIGRHPYRANGFPRRWPLSVHLTHELLTGKTTTTEFGASSIGPSTRNPHDLRRTPGGSSTGSGAAVGDLQVPVAIGTQTGGSTIRPASFNGIWGVIFTMHDLSTRGQKAFAPTFDRPSVLACDVGILKLIVKVLKIKDDKKKHLKTIRGTGFAFCKTPLWNHAGQGTKAAMEHAAELLRAHGAKVEELQLDPQFNQVADWYDTVLYKEGHKSFVTYYDDCKEKLDPTIVNLVEKGARISDREYQEALQGLAALRVQMDEVAGCYAAIIAPSVHDEAPIGLKDTGSYVFAKFWTVSRCL
jgi:amidase